MKRGRRKTDEKRRKETRKKVERREGEREEEDEEVEGGWHTWHPHARAIIYLGLLLRCQTKRWI